MEKRIIIAGSGGQGILFLGKLMAYSAMLEGKEVTWFPSYGAEMRGGTANCTVIISDSMIGSPVVRNSDILIAMNQASYNRFLGKLLSGGILIYDSSLFDIKKPPDSSIKIIQVPASELSASFKNTTSANMAMMGAFVAVTHILNIESVFQGIDDITSSRRKDLINLNKEIIMKGYSLFENTKGKDN
jgi:2-oxoglutarate ferredoxin oxidoreductase subunit gamma